MQGATELSSFRPQFMDSEIARSLQGSSVFDSSAKRNGRIYVDTKTRDHIMEKREKREQDSSHTKDNRDVRNSKSNPYNHSINNSYKATENALSQSKQQQQQRKTTRNSVLSQIMNNNPIPIRPTEKIRNTLKSLEVLNAVKLDSERFSF